VPPTQTSVEQGNWVEYHPITTVAGDSPIELDINGSGEEYIDFANTMLYIKAKLTTAAVSLTSTYIRMHQSIVKSIRKQESLLHIWTVLCGQDC